MKFIHIADTHFDTPFTNLSSKKDFGKMRRMDQREIFKKTTIEYINHLFEEIPQTQIFITPGNHDPYIKNSMYYNFEWNDNVKIFTSKIEKVTTPDVDIYGMGFEDFYHSGMNLDNIIIEDKSKINILITHGSLNAAESRITI